MPRTAQSTTENLPVATGIGDPARYLLPNEQARVAVRRHLIVLAPAVAETVGFVAIALTLVWLFPWVTWVHTIGALLIVVAAVRMAYLVLEWRMDRIVITEQRMMVVGGVLTRRIAAIPLLKITDLTFEKPLIGQLFGYGSFVVESAGQDQAFSRLEYLPRADDLYRQVSSLLFSNQRRSYLAEPTGLSPLASAGLAPAQLPPAQLPPSELPLRGLDDTDRFALPDFSAPHSEQYTEAVDQDQGSDLSSYSAAEAATSWQPRPVDPLLEQRAPRWTRRINRAGE